MQTEPTVLSLTRAARGLLIAVVVTLVAVAGASGELVPQGTKLTGAGEIGQGRFGVSVALSADGNTLLVGGNTDNNNTTFGVGAAWVFTRSAGTWTQQGPKLTAADGVNLPAFGYDVALSGDGNTALIGGPGDKGNVGAVWTFTRSNGVWTQQGPKLTATGASGPIHFGETVALSADGITAVVGAPNEGTGVMRVYTRSGTSWVQQGPPLVASDGVEFVFLGQNLALAADGNTFLTSGENENSAVGAAWVFARSNGVWAQQGPKLTVATTGSFPRFGAGLALTGDGSFALIGSSREAGTGAIWQFARSGATWAQQGGKLTAGDAGAGSGFGSEISLSRDGSRRSSRGPENESRRGVDVLAQRLDVPAARLEGRPAGPRRLEHRLRGRCRALRLRDDRRRERARGQHRTRRSVDVRHSRGGDAARRAGGSRRDAGRRAGDGVVRGARRPRAERPSAPTPSPPRRAGRARAEPRAR